MLYSILPFYKRSVYFSYDEEENKGINYLSFEKCKKINAKKPLVYRVDNNRFDSYMETYDMLPTIGGYLVSKRFKEIFSFLEDKEIEYIPAVIRNKHSEENENYLCMNVLISLPLLDMKRSLYLPSDYDEDEITIAKPFYIEENMGSIMIARMEEDLLNSPIVSEEFVSIYKKNKLKGISFEPEGSTIYTEKGLDDIRRKMKKVYGK